MQTGKILPAALVDEVSEELLVHIREDRLANLLALEVIDNDGSWVNYDFEESQAVFDLAGLVFDDMLGELLQLL